MLNFIKLSW